MDEEYYLTKEGLEETEKELEELKDVKRPEIAKRLQDSASFGDLSENVEYQEAKVAQAFIEGRILELEKILRNAVIIKEGLKSETVQVGSKIKVACEGKTKTFLIVGAPESAPEEGKISHESPLGRAFLGKKTGDIVTVDAPKGKIKYKIVMV
ncbi:transcription elongation factor GreA [Candidatus Kaiserbacteria bacterium]|nr:transcription elongation factor GreA [Candidatus Kaiserbacteria bacterium]PIQ92091.1 MAG: transcription elongation factor GreA [Parcubacteria group bacterium CG11_big_fil_rev_8_21_14_0_20_39_14]PIS35591.1 MAG: transcription elongation factor GreA [Parcubacteria group bacterium CG08_land_8_20_14_0_20_38_56]